MTIIKNFTTLVLLLFFASCAKFNPLDYCPHYEKQKACLYIAEIYVRTEYASKCFTKKVDSLARWSGLSPVHPHIGWGNYYYASPRHAALDADRWNRYFRCNIESPRESDTAILL